jgi:hypothetical protein
MRTLCAATVTGVFAVLVVTAAAQLPSSSPPTTVTGPDPWPQVCRVIMPEDLDRIDGSR